MRINNLVKTVIVTCIILGVCTIVAWGANLNQLMDCDGESPYKCEIVHSAGLIPPVALVTVWADTDKDDKQ